jgi:hypothetical protein
MVSPAADGTASKRLAKDGEPAAALTGAKAGTQIQYGDGALQKVAA